MPTRRLSGAIYVLLPGVLAKTRYFTQVARVASFLGSQVSAWGRRAAAGGQTMMPKLAPWAGTGRAHTIALLCCLCLLAGFAPNAAAAPADPVNPANPVRKAAPPPTLPVGKPNASGLVAAVTPQAGTLVPGPTVTVRVQVRHRGSTLTRATLSHRRIERYLHRRGNVYSGRVPGVAAGLAHLRVVVSAGSKEGSRDHLFTVAGRPADLLASQGTPPARASGVVPVAFTARPGTTLMATVNGRRVSNRELGRVTTTNGAYRFVASLDHGVRRGRNTIVVSAFLPDGQWESLQSTVTVPKNVPLAEGGTSGPQAQGSVLRLDGSRSRPAVRGHRLTYRWRVITAPAGTSKIANPTGRTTSLKLARPGRHVVALTVTERVGQRLRRSTDLTTVDVYTVEPPRGARLQTLVNNDASLPPCIENTPTTGTGLVFGACFRSYSQDFGQAPAGVYVIDPQKLTADTYSLPATGTDDALANVLKTSALEKFLVVLVAPAGSDTDSSKLPEGPYSHIVSYDGHGTDNFWDSGVTNAGFQLRGAEKNPGPAGSLSGYLRISLKPADASVTYRFVRDDDQLPFSTDAAGAATTTPSRGAVYRIVSTTTNQAITVGADSTVQTAGRGPTLNQQWQMVAVYGGFYKLVNQATGSCLDVQGGSGPTVDTYDCDPNAIDQPNQLWLAEYSADRSAYRFVSAAAPMAHQAGTTKYLSAVDGALQLSTGADQWWRFEVPPGIYTLAFGGPGSNKQDSSQTYRGQVGQLLSEPDYGRSWNAQLQLSKPTGELRQLWQVIDTPQGFALRNLASGLCADVPGGQVAVLGPVNRYQCDPNEADQANQQWKASATTDGVKLDSIATKESLSVAANGGVVQQNFDTTSSNPQVWTLKKVPAPVVGGSYAISLADGTGRTVQSSEANTPGAPFTAAETTAPGRANAWTLAAAGDGRVRIQRLDAQSCARLGPGGTGGLVPVVTAPCSQATSWQTQQAPDGTWNFSMGSSRIGLPLVVGKDGGLYIANNPGQIGTPFILSGQSTQFQVGEQQTTVSAAPGQSGFHVLAFGTTQQSLPNYPRSFVTSGPGSQDVQQLTDAAVDLANTPGTTVLLQSFGRPRPTSDGWNQLGTALGKLGADPTNILQLDGTGDFAMAGCAGCTSAKIDNEVNDRSGGAPSHGARLEGQFQWSSTSVREPADATSASVDTTTARLLQRADWDAWPFSEPGSSEAAALAAIKQALPSWTASCNSTGVDDLRDSYCGGTPAQWVKRIDTLEGLTYTTTDQYTQAVFNEVKAGLLNEFDQVVAVTSLFDSLNTLLGKVNGATGSVFGPTGAAQEINDTIYAPVGPTPTTGANPTNVGGVVAVIGAVFDMVIDFAPFFAATHNPTSGAVGNEFDAGDFVGNGITLASDIIELTGKKDDDSPNLGLDLRTDLNTYAALVQAQLQEVIQNLGTTENIALSNPVTLAVMAANYEAGPWALDNDQQMMFINTYQTGVLRDLWPRHLGRGFQLYRWPPLLDGYNVGDIWAADAGDPAHRLYLGQPDDASRQPVSQVDATGAPAVRSTYVLTRYLDKNTPMTHDVDRVVRQSIMDAFYAKTGYTPADLLARPEFQDPARRNDTLYPSFGRDDIGEINFWLQKPGGPRQAFPPKNW